MEMRTEWTKLESASVSRHFMDQYGDVGPGIQKRPQPAIPQSQHGRSLSNFAMERTWPSLAGGRRSNDRQCLR